MSCLLLLFHIAENNYKVSTKVVAIDFTTNYDLSKLKDELEGLDVSCLINNVGVNSEMPTKFLDLSDKEIKDMVQVNISSTLDITRLVLPKIVARYDFFLKKKPNSINFNTFFFTASVVQLSI